MADDWESRRGAEGDGRPSGPVGERVGGDGVVRGTERGWSGVDGAVDVFRRRNPGRGFGLVPGPGATWNEHCGRSAGRERRDRASVPGGSMRGAWALIGRSTRWTRSTRPYLRARWRSASLVTLSTWSRSPVCLSVYSSLAGPLRLLRKYGPATQDDARTRRLRWPGRGIRAQRILRAILRVAKRSAVRVGVESIEVVRTNAQVVRPEPFSTFLDARRARSDSE